MSNTEKYKAGWEKVYSMIINPFDIEDPYQGAVDLEEQGGIRGDVLDSGCGAGHNSIFLTSKEIKWITEIRVSIFLNAVLMSINFKQLEQIYNEWYTKTPWVG